MGNCLSQDSIKTSNFQVVEDFVDAVSLKLNKLIDDQSDIEIIGVGIGAPNGNFFSGNIEFAPNLNWKGIIPLAKLFEERLNLSTTLTNDANAAALGERIYGAAKGVDDFVMITLGTGLGSGFIANGD